MKRVLVLLVLVACSKPSTAPPTLALDGPISFRRLSEKENPRFCRESPDFAVARTEEDWIDVFDVQTECQEGSAEIKLPRVDFDTEVAIAAWWERVGCIGFGVRTATVERKGSDIVISATKKQPGDLCATAIGQLESFLAFERSDRFSGDERIVFMLDGKQVGVANGPRAT
jgi:hypothetical protein